jgi:hypothetical protein
MYVYIYITYNTTDIFRKLSMIWSLNDAIKYCRIYMNLSISFVEIFKNLTADL